MQILRQHHTSPCLTWRRQGVVLTCPLVNCYLTGGNSHWPSAHPGRLSTAPLTCVTPPIPEPPRGASAWVAQGEVVSVPPACFQACPWSSVWLPCCFPLMGGLATRMLRGASRCPGLRRRDSGRLRSMDLGHFLPWPQVSKSTLEKEKIFCKGSKVID